MLAFGVTAFDRSRTLAQQPSPLPQFVRFGSRAFCHAPGETATFSVNARNTLAALLLFVACGLLSAGCSPTAANPSATNSAEGSTAAIVPVVETDKTKPTGVLTFITDIDADGRVVNYNLETQELTDFGGGRNVYRAKNGLALVETGEELILVSPDGKARTTIMRRSLNSQKYILSPDGKTVIFDRGDVLVTHDVQTGTEIEHPIPDFEWPLPEDWMPDGNLLITPFNELKSKSDKGEDISITHAIIGKDFSVKGYVNFDQPGTKPVDHIDDLRIDTSGKRIAFRWDSHIWIANYDGSGAKQATDSEGISVGESSPAWSPDGKWLAIQHYDGQLRDIYLVPVDGKKHGMEDSAVIKLLDKKGNGFLCSSRITWR